MTSIPKKDHPDRAREERHHTGVDNEARPQFVLQANPDQQRSSRKSQGSSGCNAYHPDREEGPEQIYRWSVFKHSFVSVLRGANRIGRAKCQIG